VANPARKQPRTLRTGEPSYLMEDSTSGSERPTDSTRLNASTELRESVGFTEVSIGPQGARFKLWAAWREE
jgi:hypothetical protein